MIVEVSNISNTWIHIRVMREILLVGCQFSKWDVFDSAEVYLLPINHLIIVFSHLVS